MTDTDYLGRWWRLRPNPGCQECWGTGEVFGHAADCDDDLCALNGDMHSCVGQLDRCHCVRVAAAIGETMP